MKQWTTLILLLTVHAAWAQLPAFPGAQGFGRMAQGGRGGSVIAVTNLNDSGPGSLREALETSGARTIVFRTGGIIALQSELQVTEPYLTIAAQTAPGDGVVLKNFGISVFTHDVVIRGLRIRPADDDHTLGPDTRDCLTIQEGAHHVIADHCSFSWAVDENVNLWTGANHVTVQWCIVSEGLYRGIHPKGPHSMGLLIGNGSHTASVHHCLMAHNNGRNPLYMGGTDLEFINNTVYDHGYASEFQESGAQLRADIIGNRWKPGNAPFDVDELPLSIDFDANDNMGSLLHISGNVWPGGPFLTEAQIAAFGANGALFPTSTVMTQASGVEVQLANDAHEAVLQWAGALHPARDEADVRVVAQVADSTGHIIDCVRQGPVLLDDGTAIGATASTLIYSVLDDAIKYSAEGREVRILSGTGAGQVRTGMAMGIVDELTQVVEVTVDEPWDVLPDATSQFSITALCTYTLGGYPAYAAGSPYTDADNDGMADEWELANGLDPTDPDDRNGLTVSDEGYTDLESYLNSYYMDGSPMAMTERPAALAMGIFPNPFTHATTITLVQGQSGKGIITDMHGRAVRTFALMPTFVWDGADDAGNAVPSGVYLVQVRTEAATAHGKVIVAR
jgi:pectate lyase